MAESTSNTLGLYMCRWKWVGTVGLSTVEGAERVMSGSRTGGSE